MLYEEGNRELLKDWIVRRLGEISKSGGEVDDDVLAEYVLALLAHEGEAADIRALCEKELPDFLKDGVSAFVADVFQALQYRTYLPGATQPPKSVLQPSSSVYSSTVAMPHAAPQNTSRKRGYNETVSSDTPNGHDTQPHGRAFKQARRGTNKGRGGGAGDMNGARHVRAAPGFQLPYGAPPPLSFDPMQPPHGLAANPFFNQMTMPLITGIPTRPRRAACRDFVTKGFCGRKNCHYEHTHAGPAGEELDFLAPLPLLPSNDEYDPNRAGLGLDDLGDQLPLRFDSIFQAAMGGGPAFLPLPQSGPPKERNRKGRSPFSADRPVLDKSQSTVVVENIPDQYFSKSDVLAFFSQFGDIENITMQPYRRLAIVKFDSWSAANAAYRSPKVMFENRFVKVFWYKADGSNVSAAPGPLGGAVRDLLATNGHAADADGYPDAEAEVEIDMEEFTRKQEEAQKLFEERRSKTEALERQRETLERRHKELLSKQQAEKQRLRARLASAGAAKDSDRSPSPEITMGGNVTRPSPSKATSDALRTLAALEEEAKQLGLDPDAADDDAASFWTPRGRGRGRGGYFPRARGYAPRGYRGGQRGRGGLAAAFAAYSLDNRPKKVVVSGVDFTSPEKGDALRQFLLGVGDFADMETTTSATHITFADRHTAEKFYYSVAAGKAIPGIEGPLELAWATAPVSGTAKDSGSAAPPKTAAVKIKVDANNDVMMDLPSAPPVGDAAQLDFDVADDNEWDI